MARPGPGKLPGPAGRRSVSEWRSDSEAGSVAAAAFAVPARGGRGPAIDLMIRPAESRAES